jgi:hypothetical protein
MPGLAAAVVALSLALFVALRRQRRCGVQQWEMMYTCVGLVLGRGHREHRVYAQGPVPVWERSSWVDWDTHVWYSDEYLESGRSPRWPRRRTPVRTLGWHDYRGDPELWRRYDWDSPEMKILAVYRYIPRPEDLIVKVATI